MITAEEIKRVVSELSAADLALFRTWFAEFDAANWDRQIESDVTAGRLDTLAEQAIIEQGAGLSTPL